MEICCNWRGGEKKWGQAAKKTEMEVGGVVIHMVNGNSKGFKVLGKNEEYGVSDVWVSWWSFKTGGIIRKIFTDITGGIRK